MGLKSLGLEVFFHKNMNIFKEAGLIAKRNQLRAKWNGNARVLIAQCENNFEKMDDIMVRLIMKSKDIDEQIQTLDKKLGPKNWLK